MTSPMCGTILRGFEGGVLPEAAVTLAANKGWITSEEAAAIIAGDPDPCG